ncbi:hypothetical protein [Gemmatimonas sp.]
MRSYPVIKNVATRRGRVLVECCVSLVLLAGGSTLILVLSTTTAFLVDEARQQDTVLRETANQFALLDAAPCAITSASTNINVGPRIRMSVAAGTSGGLAHVSVRTIWVSSGYGGALPHHHAISSAARCE